VVEVHQQVPGLLGDPGAGRMGGHPDDVDLAGGDLDEEQHVDPFEQHGVDGEEVAGQHRVRLRGEELFPGRPGPPRRRVDAGLVENVPDRAGRYLVAQADQLTLNPAMPPRRVLGGQPQHQLADLLVDRWSAGPGMRVRPAPGDQLPMPAKQRRRGDEERRPAGPGQQPGQGGQHHPVGRFKAGRCTWRRSTAT
jgi:hypothetical protein